MTGQPDFAHLVIDHVPGLWLVESKPLKLYLGSLRKRVVAPRPNPKRVLAAGAHAGPDGLSQGTLVFDLVPWEWDGGKRRERVLDHDHTPPKVVRIAGWAFCICCAKGVFSQDLHALRLCNSCKGGCHETPECPCSGVWASCPPRVLKGTDGRKTIGL